MHHIHTRGPSARAAFTLIELLVVISIIGLMTGLIVAGAMKFKDVSRVNAADAQVTKYQRALELEYNLIVQKCHKDGPPDAVLSLFGGNQDKARAVHTAATLKINFPESFDEAINGSFSINGQPYNVKSTFASVKGATTSPPPVVRNPSIASSDYERAVLLYLIVKEKATAGTGADTDAGGEQRTEQFGTKGLTYFIDSYGYPLVYYRWATDGPNGELNAPPYTAQSALSADPLDPKNLFAGGSGAPTGLGFNSKNRVPTVISFGKDQRFDYFVPKGTQLPVPPYATGDLSNADDRVGYRLTRFGAKGDGK